MRIIRKHGIAVPVLGMLCPLFVLSQPPGPAKLADASLEELMNITVTSVSKTEQTLARTSAAVFVINQDDIRRSGAVNIPDLLRMAPGVDVEQIDANAWAISIRGFNQRYSNKVLVMVDGRTVYTPAFSGVYWDQIDLPLEDIERIEVIRGPGASVWGANAVNGVISILTKSSKDTQGTLVTAGGGSQMKSLAQVRYGGTAGSEGTYRVFGKFFDVANSAAVTGGPASDHWTRMHGGFRADWNLSKRDTLAVEGDLFSNEESQTRQTSFIPGVPERIFVQGADVAGGDLMARWNHTATSGSESSVQAYYDTYRRDDLGTPLVTKRFDLDFQDHLYAGRRNEIVWGLGYRANSTKISPGYATSFSPLSQTTSLYSAFLQDEIRLSDSFLLTVGGKLEHNPYTGFEIEPSVRLSWSPPSATYGIWASASRALRQPSRQDVDVRANLETIPLGPDSSETLRLFGNRDIKDEEVRDYELGYRSQLTKNLSLDVATFLSFYSHLETVVPQAPITISASPLVLQIPLIYGNNANATTYGGETSLTWRAAARWKITTGYSLLHAVLRKHAPQDLPTNTVATDFPQNMFQVRSIFNLSTKTEFDQSLYYTARLPGGVIPGHARLDIRLARRIGESVEVSVVGQNLLRRGSLEYGDAPGIVGTQSVRSVYGKITWRR